MDHTELSVRLEQLDRIQLQVELWQSQLKEASSRYEFASTSIRNNAELKNEVNKVDPQITSSTRKYY